MQAVPPKKRIYRHNQFHGSLNQHEIFREEKEKRQPSALAAAPGLHPLHRCSQHPCDAAGPLCARGRPPGKGSEGRAAVRAPAARRLLPAAGARTPRGESPGSGSGTAPTQGGLERTWEPQPCSAVPGEGQRRQRQGPRVQGRAAPGRRARARAGPAANHTSRAPVPPQPRNGLAGSLVGGKPAPGEVAARGREERSAAPPPAPPPLPAQPQGRSRRRRTAGPCGGQGQAGPGPRHSPRGRSCGAAPPAHTPSWRSAPAPAAPQAGGRGLMAGARRAGAGGSGAGPANRPAPNPRCRPTAPAPPHASRVRNGVRCAHARGRARPSRAAESDGPSRTRAEWSRKPSGAERGGAESEPR